MNYDTFSNGIINNVRADLVSALICRYVAKQRQSNPVFWTAMGFSFGPLAIPFVFLSKPNPRKPTPTH